jgi:hypothetical protein
MLGGWVLAIAIALKVARRSKGAAAFWNFVGVLLLALFVIGILLYCFFYFVILGMYM